LHNEELDNLFYSPNIIRMMKSRRIRGAGHVARLVRRRRKRRRRMLLRFWWQSQEKRNH
jgi:hypothetical protein